MDVKAFIEYLLENDLICDRYRDAVASARSKAELFEILSDTNGCEFVCSRISAEHPIDYSDVENYFVNHINGKRTITHRSTEGEYTSKVFCNYEGSIFGDTTLLTLLGCKARVDVKENYILQIYCDYETSCEICCPENSRAVCVYWGNRPSAVGLGEVRFIKGEKED